MNKLVIIIGIYFLLVTIGAAPREEKHAHSNKNHVHGRNRHGHLKENHQREQRKKNNESVQKRNNNHWQEHGQKTDNEISLNTKAKNHLKEGYGERVWEGYGDDHQKRHGHIKKTHKHEQKKRSHKNIIPTSQIKRHGGKHYYAKKHRHLRNDNAGEKLKKSHEVFTNVGHTKKHGSLNQFSGQPLAKRNKDFQLRHLFNDHELSPGEESSGDNVGCDCLIPHLEDIYGFIAPLSPAFKCTE